jgi:hypothetical protein
MKLTQADDKTLKIIGMVAQQLLDDMHNSAKLQIKLTEKIAFNQGRDVGFAEGYKACQHDMKKAMFQFQYVAGIIKLEECE